MLAPKSLYVIGRDTVSEARQLLDADPSAEVLLLGRAVMLPASLLGGRPVFAMQEEIQEMGLEGKVSPMVKALSAREVVGLLLERKVFNFG